MQCPHFRVTPAQGAPNSSSPAPQHSTWKPKAHMATSADSPSSSWLLDSGASHHVTADLANLSLYTLYDGRDDIVIGKGAGLHISHTSSTSLSSSTYSFDLHDVLFVLDMTQNLISISQFCYTNNASIEFQSSCFRVKDLQMGEVLLEGKPKDGV